MAPEIPSNKEKILIVDGMALIFRAYYAIRYGMSTKAGLPTNAVYGFTSMLLNTILNQDPEYVVLTFDLAGPTFRSEAFVEYKAQREKAPDELYQQIPLCKEITRAFEIPIFEMQGYEADDMIGTISKVVSGHGVHSLILTGDLDTLQLVDENTWVVAPQNGMSEAKIYDREATIEKMGVPPEQVIDYKGLRGDTSDNIPGVYGIGQKTAVKLLKEFGSIEGIYENLDQINGSVHDKLAANQDMAHLSRRLATIVRDIDIPFDLEACRTHHFDKSVVKQLFDQFEFGNTIRGKLDRLKSREEIRMEEMQQSLF